MSKNLIDIGSKTLEVYFKSIPLDGLMMREVKIHKELGDEMISPKDEALIKLWSVDHAFHEVIIDKTIEFESHPIYLIFIEKDKTKGFTHFVVVKRWETKHPEKYQEKETVDIYQIPKEIL